MVKSEDVPLSTLVISSDDVVASEASVPDEGDGVVVSSKPVTCCSGVVDVMSTVL